jgi:hypothetical protein
MFFYFGRQDKGLLFMKVPLLFPSCFLIAYCVLFYNYLFCLCNISRMLPFTLFYMYICIYINLGTDSIFD